MSDQWRGIYVYGHPPEFHVTFGGGGLILYTKILVPTIELPKRRFQTFLDMSLPEKLIGKSHCPQNKIFICEMFFFSKKVRMLSSSSYATVQSSSSEYYRTMKLSKWLV